MKILFLGSNPDDTTRLRLDREYRAIDQHLQEGGKRDELELLSSWAVRLSDLSRELLRWQPDIVHFSGHGSPDGLVFEGDDGKSRYAPIEPLADLFGIIDEVTGVVLNACYSHAQAEALRTHVRFVVGTTAPISDAGAIVFASGFYRGLSFGKSWEEAVQLGKVQLRLEGLTDAAIIQSAPGKKA